MFQNNSASTTMIAGFKTLLSPYIVQATRGIHIYKICPTGPRCFSETDCVQVADVLSITASPPIAFSSGQFENCCLSHYGFQGPNAFPIHRDLLADVKFGKVVARSLRSTSLINGEPANQPTDHIVSKSEPFFAWTITTIVDDGLLQLSCGENCDGSVYIGGNSIRWWLEEIKLAFQDVSRALNSLKV